jgi:putative addiction module CopG family antidote
MRTTQQFSITLPMDMAEVIEKKIKSGMYASASEVMRDGVRALLERDAALERWLREEVVARRQEYTADPPRGCLQRKWLTASAPGVMRNANDDEQGVRVIFTPRAERHIETLYDYIAERAGRCAPRPTSRASWRSV